MEKMTLKNETALKSAVTLFGKKYKNDIKEAVKSYPCILIANYSDDIDMGSGYDFTAIFPSDFYRKNAEVFMD